MVNLIANKFPGGYSFTLTTYALKYLLEAESIFGPRTKDYTYAGIELNPVGPPLIWYPFDKFVVIQVSESTALDAKQAIFQIAHEIIHVLSPNGQAKTSNLEEGLATYFSKIVTDRDTDDFDYAINAIKLTKYFYPYELITKLLDIKPDAIFELRKIQPMLGKISKEDFKNASINVDENLIDELLKIMDY